MIEEHLELWLGILVCGVLGAVYAVYALVAHASGGQPFGEFMGMMGMALMVVTEIVYSIRKRAQWLHWLGSLRVWLSFHILTGIVGPFLVLLHSAFTLGGLAGIALEMAGVVVLSGFVGRYIYTAVPRTRAGIEVSREELKVRAEKVREELDKWLTEKPDLESTLRSMAAPQAASSAWSGVLTRAWTDMNYRRKLSATLRAWERTERARVRELKHLLENQRRLERQIASLEWVHRLMGVWRLVHIPLGITLFTTAIVHVIAALYFKGISF